MRRLLPAAFVPVLLCATTAAADGIAAGSQLDRAFQQMYNLNFTGAEVEIAAHKAAHPQDPLGDVAEAASHLFAEFDRLQVLHTEFFTNDNNYRSRKPQQPDVKVKREFDASLRRAEDLAGQQLRADAEDRNALFAMTFLYGLKADYTALIERRDWAALGYTKTATMWSEKLLAIAPDYYDAYLGAGIGKYLASLKPAPVRWFLRLDGVRSDREEGLRELRLTAEHGRFLAPFARLLIAIDHLRSGHRAQALQVLSQLHDEFPLNPLFANEMERLKQTK